MNTISDVSPLQPESSPKVSLEEHARISAEVTEGTHSQAEVLQAHGLSEHEWNEVTIYWMDQIGRDVEANGADATLAVTYSDAFARHQDSLGRTLTFSAEQWAELQYDIEKAGTLTEPLAARQLSQPDYFRLMRSYTQRLATEPETQLRFEARDAALRTSR